MPNVLLTGRSIFPGLEFKVEIGTGGSVVLGSKWDTALWDTALWDGTDISWLDITSDVMSVATDGGKDSFNTRFRTGMMSVLLDNTYGQWTPGAGAGDPGVVRLRPGRQMRLSIRFEDGTWMPIFTGRIDTLQDQHNQGFVTTRVHVYDAFAGFAVDDEPASAPQGAGELSGARINRILDHIAWSQDDRDIQAGVATLQETTLAATAIQDMSDAADAEGGDLFMSGAGAVTFKARDWLATDERSVEEQWYLGGPGIPISAAEPSWTIQRVVNDASYANAGGTAQHVTDQPSIATYGRRTFQRHDLIAEDDSQANYLATRTVSNLKDDQPRIKTVTVPAVSIQQILFGLGIRFGDLTLIDVATKWGWSQSIVGWIIGISHTVTPSSWDITITLENAERPNINGGYWYESFSAGYQLGGHL